MILLRHPLIFAHGASPAFPTTRGLVGIVNPLAPTMELVLAIVFAQTG